MNAFWPNFKCLSDSDRPAPSLSHLLRVQIFFAFLANFSVLWHEFAAADLSYPNKPSTRLFYQVQSI